MGRKTVKDLRANEILDAFEVCIARQGFNNVTLADIGRQADIKRPAIRHSSATEMTCARRLPDVMLIELSSR